MWASTREQVINQTRHYKKIAETKKGQGTVLLNESKRPSRHSRRQDPNRRQQHQSLVHVRLAPEIKGGAHKDRKHQYVAQRYCQK